MKKITTALMALMTIVIVFAMTGCVEHRYYRVHHDHSPEYYHRHHREPRVDLNIHN